MPIQILPDPLSLLRPVSAISTVSKVRPADTAVYAANDAISESTTVGTVWTFAGAARSNGLGSVLQDAVLTHSAVTALNLDAELWLFDTAPTSGINDNGAWTPTDAEMKTLLAVLVFSGSAVRTGNGNTACELSGLSRAIKCAAGTSSIFGVLRAKNAYVPTSAEEITLRLKFIQD